MRDVLAKMWEVSQNAGFPARLRDGWHLCVCASSWWFLWSSWKMCGSAKKPEGIKCADIDTRIYQCSLFRSFISGHSFYTSADLLLFVPHSRHLPPSSPPHHSPEVSLAFLCFFGLPLFLLVLISPVCFLFDLCIQNNLIFPFCTNIHQHIIIIMFVLVVHFLSFQVSPCDHPPGPVPVQRLGPGEPRSRGTVWPRGTLGHARAMSPYGCRRTPRRIRGAGRREGAPLLRRTTAAAVSRPGVADEGEGRENKNRFILVRHSSYWHLFLSFDDFPNTMSLKSIKKLLICNGLRHKCFHFLVTHSISSCFQFWAIFNFVLFSKAFNGGNINLFPLTARPGLPLSPPETAFLESPYYRPQTASIADRHRPTNFHSVTYTQTDDAAFEAGSDNDHKSFLRMRVIFKVEYPAELFRFRRVLDDILSSFDVF